MKKSKLLVLSLLAVSAMSLTSCNEGAQGPKGDTGAQGEKGETGNPGKDGKDGIDGKSFLNGEGVPSDTLGNDGDSYVDTKTFDYYTKENGKWVKKGSIKGDQGEQGEKGEKGDTGAKGDAGEKGEKGDTGSKGSTGSQGDKGDTAWSNTILPSDGGYIVPSVGSATKGTEVTFKVVCDEGNTLKSFKLGDAAQTVGEPTYSNKQFVYEFTATMPDYGFVVSAEFNKGVVAAFDGGYVTKEAVESSNYKYTVHQSDEYVFTTLKFNSGDGVTTVSSEDGKTFTYTCATNYALNVINARFVEESGLNSRTIVNQKNGELFSDLITAFDKGGTNSSDGGVFRLVKDTTYETPSYAHDNSYAITHHNITLDLNGKTLNSAYVINLGTGVETFNITGYGTVSSTVGTGLSVLNIMTGTTNGSIVTLDEHVKLSSSTASYGVSVSNKARALKWDGGTDNPYNGFEDTPNGVKTTLNIEGSIDITSDNGVGLGMGVDVAPEKTDQSGQNSLHADLFSGLSAFGDLLGGTAYNVTVNVKDGASISATSKAIELAVGQLNINTGATVEATGTDGYALYASNEASGKAAVNVEGSGSAQLTGKVVVNQNIKVTVADGASINDSSEQTYTVYKGEHGTVTVSSMTAVDNKFIYDIKPEDGYVVSSIKVKAHGSTDEHITEVSENKLVLDSKPDDVYSVTATFTQVKESDTVVSTDGNAYDSLKAAIDAVGHLNAGNTVITLVKDIEVDENIEVTDIKGSIRINLNGHNIKLKDLDKPDIENNLCAYRISVRNAVLYVTGKGEVSSSDVIFNLMGGYKNVAYWVKSDGTIHTDHNVNTNGLNSGQTEHKDGATYTDGCTLRTRNLTSLIITEKVVTKSKKEAIGVYKTVIKDESEYSLEAKGLTNEVLVNFQGKDESAEGIVYVNGDIKKTGKKYDKDTTSWVDDNEGHPHITIDSASSTGKAYIAGYCDLTVKKSTFTTQGTAFNIKSGKINFENNTFNNDLANINIKTPYYVGDSEGALNGNATIWLQDNISGYAGIDSATFKNNTFKYTNADDKVDSYYNVGLFGDNGNVKTNIVEPSFLDASGNKVTEPEKYIANKYSDMKYKKTFSYTGGILTAYFLDENAANNYSAEQLLNEFNASSSAFPNLTAGQVEKINPAK